MKPCQSGVRILLLGLLLAGPLGFAAGASAPTVVSQKGRSFNPRSVQIRLAEPLIVQNDDEYVHDVYVSAANFDFDSGEQAVGQSVRITFPATGTYQVLCAIHPKMRLVVDVQ